MTTTLLPPFPIGTHLMVELLAAAECFVGELHFRSPTGQRLELANALNWTTGERLHSVQTFYRNEIRSVRRLPDGRKADSDSSGGAPPTTTTEADSASSSASPPGSSSPTTESATTTTSSRLSVDQLERIRCAIRSPVYHAVADSRFHAAVAALQREPAVALAVGYAYQGLRSTVGVLCVTGGQQRPADGDDDARPAMTKTTTTLTTDDSSSIHIFDIVSMGGRVPTVLRRLLTAVRPHKIMHDSTLPAYVLRTAHDLTVGGVFEVRMAHAALGGSGGATLAALLELYLHVPAGAQRQLDARDENDDHGNHNADADADARLDHVDWTRRPLGERRRRQAAAQVAYLPALHDHLLYGRMLGAFFAGCQRFAHEYSGDGDAGGGGGGPDEVDVACRVSMRQRVEPTPVATIGAGGGGEAALRRLRPFRVAPATDA